MGLCAAEEAKALPVAAAGEASQLEAIATDVAEVVEVTELCAELERCLEAALERAGGDASHVVLVLDLDETAFTPLNPDALGTSSHVNLNHLERKKHCGSPKLYYLSRAPPSTTSGQYTAVQGALQHTRALTTVTHYPTVTLLSAFLLHYHQRPSSKHRCIRVLEDEYTRCGPKYLLNCSRLREMTVGNL